MATRIPLVIVAGQIEQLQSGDTLAVPSETNSTGYSLTNGDVGSTTIGEVVYISAADTANAAKADAAGTAPAFAIASAVITSSSAGTYLTSGTITGLTGLTAGSVYYLSDALAGAMTTTAPTTVGHYVVRLGVAVSATEFDIDIQAPILL